MAVEVAKPVAVPQPYPVPVEVVKHVPVAVPQPYPVAVGVPVPGTIKYDFKGLNKANHKAFKGLKEGLKKGHHDLGGFDAFSSLGGSSFGAFPSTFGGFNSYLPNFQASAYSLPQTFSQSLVAQPYALPEQPAQQYAPAPQYAAPQQQYAAPQQQYAAPQQQYAAPQQQYAAPQQQYAAPSYSAQPYEQHQIGYRDAGVGQAQTTFRDAKDYQQQEQGASTSGNVRFEDESDDSTFRVPSSGSGSSSDVKFAAKRQADDRSPGYVHFPNDDGVAPKRKRSVSEEDQTLPAPVPNEVRCSSCCCHPC